MSQETIATMTFGLQLLNVLVIPALYGVGKVLLGLHTRLVRVESRLETLLKEYDADTGREE